MSAEPLIFCIFRVSGFFFQKVFRFFYINNTTYDFKDYSFSSLRARYKKWTGKSFDDTQFESFGVVDEKR